jgi:hypothetical protein
MAATYGRPGTRDGRPVLGPNVILDDASAYAWSDLNETVFLTKFFEHLKSEMGERFEQYNFYIVSSHKPGAVPHSVSSDHRRKVLFFISDDQSSIPIDLKDHYLAIFKTHLPHEISDSNIFPFNLGYVREVPELPVISTTDRPIDVFFSGNLNKNRFEFYHSLHPIIKHLPIAIAAGVARRCKLRKDLSLILPKSQISFTDGFKRGLSPTRYGELLAQSKIALCPKGNVSRETFRHVEAIRAGAIVISQPLPNTHFYRKAPIFIISNWRDALKEIRLLLRDHSRLLALQGNTVSWWQQVLSEAATAHFVADTLRRI